MRIYLATMSPQEARLVSEVVKPKYLLTSFYEGERACKNTLDICGSDNFLLDSGAFSFMSGATSSEKLLEEYAERYADFIKRNNITQYFELDVDTIFGLSFAEALRAKIEKATGVQSIPVWHKSRGVAYWKRMCDEYKYIAIGGLVFHVKKVELPHIKKLVDYAYAKGVKVHGLGFTKTQELSKWKWYSVDSSSWKCGAVRGSQRYIFNGRGLDCRRIEGRGYKVDQHRLAINNGIE